MLCRPLFFLNPLLLAILLGGCAMGPDFQRPQAPSANGYTPQEKPGTTAATPGLAGEPQHFDVQKDLPFDWWTMFHSKDIDDLIELTFKNNPTIPAAQAALQQAQSMTVAQEGFFFPTVGVSYMPSRNKLAGNMGEFARNSRKRSGHTDLQ